MIKIFNSLTKKKEAFIPLSPGKISIYICGMTVYDYCHIGHARSWIVFDTIIRYLRSKNWIVNFVRNITDIDDKIIKRANENKEDWQALTTRFIDAFHEDEKSLGILRPDHEPRATDFIPKMITLIQKIIDNGYAYIAKNGDVYFDVRRFKHYGQLSHRDIDQLIAGARVEIGELKRDPLDFALWKIAKSGEPSWDSPWGKGRPGWHIECSTMSTDILGQPFDIHGGGLDLKFPHHENEIAQSEAACQKKFANIWMHAGLLQVSNEKMSKSLGNFFTIREMLEKHHPEVLRYFMLSGHYRSALNYTEDNLRQSRSALERLYLAIRGLSINENKEETAKSDYQQRFHEAMDDDFNTPEAFAVLFDLAHEINRLREKNELEKAMHLACELKQMSRVFGILQENPEVFLQGSLNDEELQKITQLIAQREQARANKAWALADKIREDLTKLGISIEDKPDGTIWRKTNTADAD